MIQESAADFLPIWMLLSAAFGFLDRRRVRRQHSSPQVPPTGQ